MGNWTLIFKKARLFIALLHVWNSPNHLLAIPLPCHTLEGVLSVSSSIMPAPRVLVKGGIAFE
jgi:hypothetical protein